MRNQILRLVILSLLASLSLFAKSDELDDGIYEFNRGEFKAAIAIFQPMVEEGFAPAQYQMALMYKGGYGVAKNISTAFELFSLAAETNYPDAQFELSLFYWNGLVVKKDLKKAFELTHKAAKKDIASAQFNLAVMYYKGEGAKQDDFKASRWYQRAADQNYALAQFNLALLYSEGKGVEKSTEMSYIWNIIAAQNGYLDADTSRKIDERSLTPREMERAQEKARQIYQNIRKQEKLKARLAQNKQVI